MKKLEIAKFANDEYYRKQAELKEKQIAKQVRFNTFKVVMMFTICIIIVGIFEAL